MLVEKTCENCGKKFRTQQCWINRNRGDGKTCSIKCRIKYLTGRPQKKTNSRKFTCLNCKREFEIPYAWAKRGQGKYCGIKCKRQFERLRSLIRLKRKNTTHREAYKSIFYREWRTQVFQRDKYTCRRCGARNGMGKDIYLEAHHIKSWKEYPKLRFEVSNGLTICLGCHNKTRGNYQNFLRRK